MVGDAGGGELPLLPPAPQPPKNNTTKEYTKSNKLRLKAQALCSSKIYGRLL
jgi:hypothetical protein